ncbi:MAG: thioredoxin family protein [Lewinellaceae bacterium]|nr:thioredoxin family protein [Phaeodactylibacter sp.]MCB9041198.1 thioredoxin family protein [Lewinellaceae bacterium]
MKRTVEVFTAGCPVCDPVVHLVRETVCENCEITGYDLVKQCEEKECIAKVSEYGISHLPAVVVNGRLLDCCKSDAITKEELLAAGVGIA